MRAADKRAFTLCYPVVTPESASAGTWQGGQNAEPQSRPPKTRSQLNDRSNAYGAAQARARARSRAESSSAKADGVVGQGSQNLQDAFLNQLRKHKTPVTMFLVKGVKLQGIVTWFDNFSILLRRDGQSQLVYKHAISTIMPSAAGRCRRCLPHAAEGDEEAAPAAGRVPRRVRDAEVQVTMFLVNGVMLQGRIAAYDLFCMLLEREGFVQLRLQACGLDDPAGSAGRPVRPADEGEVTKARQHLSLQRRYRRRSNTRRAGAGRRSPTSARNAQRKISTRGSRRRRGWRMAIGLVVAEAFYRARSARCARRRCSAKARSNASPPPASRKKPSW